MAAAPFGGAFTQQWWDGFLPHLRAWRATRPRSSEFLTPRAQARFAALTQAWAVTVAQHLEEDIEDVEWHEIAAFPTLVAEIKDVPSPIFTSKFCHLLAPRIFPVVDNTSMGNPFATYEAYYTAARGEWADTNADTRNHLVERLVEEVGAPLFEGFPVKCKLIELCIIGRHNNG